MDLPPHSLHWLDGLAPAEALFPTLITWSASGLCLLHSLLLRLRINCPQLMTRLFLFQLFLLVALLGPFDSLFLGLWIHCPQLSAGLLMWQCSLPLSLLPPLSICLVVSLRGKRGCSSLCPRLATRRSERLHLARTHTASFCVDASDDARYVDRVCGALCAFEGGLAPHGF
jgi:hypothetical protein